MNKERKVIEELRFGRDVKATELNEMSQFYSRMFVNGNVVLDKPLCVSSELYVSGDIFCELSFDNGGTIKAKNGLWCYGDIKASNISVSEYFLATRIAAKRINVAGDFFVNKGIICSREEINVAGDLSGEGNILSADGDINVYGDIDFIGIIEPTKYTLHAGTITSKKLTVMGASNVKLGY